MIYWLSINRNKYALMQVKESSHGKDWIRSNLKVLFFVMQYMQSAFGSCICLTYVLAKVAANTFMVLSIL